MLYLFLLLFVVLSNAKRGNEPKDLTNTVVEEAFIQVRYPQHVEHVSSFTSIDMQFYHEMGVFPAASKEYLWEGTKDLQKNQRMGSRTTDGKRLPTKGANVRLRSVEASKIAPHYRKIIKSDILTLWNASFDLPLEAKISRVVVHVETELFKGDSSTQSSIDNPHSEVEHRVIEWDTNEHIMAREQPLYFDSVPEGLSLKAILFKEHQSWSIPLAMNQTYNGQVMNFPVDHQRESAQSITRDGSAILFGYGVPAQLAWDFPWVSNVVNHQGFGVALQYECVRDALMDQADEDAFSVTSNNATSTRKKKKKKKGNRFRADWCNFDMRVNYVTILVEYEKWSSDDFINGDKWDESSTVNCPARQNGCDCFLEEAAAKTDKIVIKAGSQQNPIKNNDPNLNSYYRHTQCFPPFWVSPPSPVRTAEQQDVVMATEAFYVIPPLSVLYIRDYSSLVIRRPLSFAARVDLELMTIPGEYPCQIGAVAMLKDGYHISLDNITPGASRGLIEREHLEEAMIQNQWELGTGNGGGQATDQEIASKCSLQFYTKPTMGHPENGASLDVLVLDAEDISDFFRSFRVSTPNFKIRQILVYSGSSCIRIDDTAYLEFTDLTEVLPIRLDISLSDGRILTKAGGGVNSTMGIKGSRKQKGNDNVMFVDYVEVEEGVDGSSSYEDEDDEEEYLFEVMEDDPEERKRVMDNLNKFPIYTESEEESNFDYLQRQFEAENEELIAAECLDFYDLRAYFLPHKGILYEVSVRMHDDCKNWLQRRGETLNRMGGGDLHLGYIIILSLVLAGGVFVLFKYIYRAHVQAWLTAWRDRKKTNAKGSAKSQKQQGRKIVPRKTKKKDKQAEDKV